MMKKMFALMLALLLLGSLTACGTSGADDGKYVVGICQLVAHPSLDEASRGFRDALEAALGEDAVVIRHQDAGDEYTNCGTIVDGFVAEGVDLILANGTSPLQAAVSATGDIPILGTSVTDYAAALGLDSWDGTASGNVSGTTDLAPLDQQAAVIQELFPDAKSVGMLYCSAEANSVYQINLVRGYLEDMGYVCTPYSFADVNELAAVTEKACETSDVIYIPTDNACAASPGVIANVVLPAGVPVVSGDSATCSVAGVATMSISYYDLGYATGEMAAKILTGEADVSAMPVQAAGQAVKKYNPANCDRLGITIPAGYEPVE